jgi:crotonobetainyl-CoA:carnitine CoA-transferase CaiB-like acyl-CoA transferase
MARLQGAGLAVGMVKTYADIEAESQVQAMGTVVSVGEDSPIRTVRAPAQYESWRPAYRVPPPGLGAHTDEVLGELGYTAADAAALAADGVVG